VDATEGVLFESVKGVVPAFVHAGAEEVAGEDGEDAFAAGLGESADGDVFDHLSADGSVATNLVVDGGFDEEEAAGDEGFGGTGIVGDTEGIDECDEGHGRGETEELAEGLVLEGGEERGDVGAAVEGEAHHLAEALGVEDEIGIAE